MAKAQVEPFAWINMGDSHWRTRARSYLTRKQRDSKRTKLQAAATSRSKLRLGYPIIASKDDHEGGQGGGPLVDQLTIAKRESPWSLLDPSQMNVPNILPNGKIGIFERVAMDHCTFISLSHYCPITETITGVSGLGYSTYRFKPRSFPFCALLQEALQDPACLHILLAKTALHLGVARQTSNPHVVSCANFEPSKEILWHKSQGMQIVQERIARTFGKPDPMTVQAVLFLAQLEDRFGYHGAAAVHLKGLRDMVDLFGGFLAFTPYPKLQLQLAWVSPLHTIELCRLDV
jgi:Fungal specific transcription factor domain